MPSLPVEYSRHSGSDSEANIALNSPKPGRYFHYRFLISFPEFGSRVIPRLSTPKDENPNPALLPHPVDAKKNLTLAAIPNMKGEAASSPRNLGPIRAPNALSMNIPIAKPTTPPKQPEEPGKIGSAIDEGLWSIPPGICCLFQLV